MDLLMQKGNPFANKPEMNRRRAEGLCLGCDGAGHFLVNVLHDAPRISPFQDILANFYSCEGYVLESENEMFLGSVAPRDN